MHPASKIAVPVAMMGIVLMPPFWLIANPLTGRRDIDEPLRQG
jgi:hypothetical protein